MFDIFLSGNEASKKNVRKGLTFSFSLLLHAALIITVIVMPILQAESKLPRFKPTMIRITSPILPGVPPGPGGRRGRPGTTNAEPPKGGKSTGHGEGPIVLTAPGKVPAKVSEEDPTKLIPQEPVGPGIEGIDPKSPWKMGEEIKTDEIIPEAGTKTIVRAPRLIKRVNPDYPPLAILSRVAGEVVIEARTDIFGRVNETRAISGHNLLIQEALTAVRKWIYEPYLVNGIPMPVQFTVTITFNLKIR
ncbi:MAG: TonB family protein [Candidatus Aminicenantes bacterium]|nr:TonB family protein [Candidatus Aminicenantes bacterium]